MTHARTLIAKSTDPIVFGGKKLFKERCVHKISHEEFIMKKLLPLTSIGEAIRYANRLFTILDEKTILFKLTKHDHFNLNISSLGKKRTKEIKQLIELQNNQQISITYKLDLNYIYLTFDYNQLKTYNYHVKPNRVMAIDMNPNFVVGLLLIGLMMINIT